MSSTVSSATRAAPATTVTKKRRVIRLSPKQERSSLTALLVLCVASAIAGITYVIYRQWKASKDASKPADEKSGGGDNNNGLPTQEQLDKMTDEEKAAALEAALQRQRERQGDPTLTLEEVKKSAVQGRGLSSSATAARAAAAGMLASSASTTSEDDGTAPSTAPPTGDPIKEFVRTPAQRIRQKLIDLCPPPNQILEVGTSGVYHCYKPCPAGFEAIVIDPNAEAEEQFVIQLEDGSISIPRDSDGEVVRPQPYQACRAKCPPGTDASGTSGNSCTRTFIPRAREQGSGEDIVKCPWVPPVSEQGDIYVVKQHGTLARRTNDGQDCSDTVLTKSKSYECAKGRLDTTWVGGDLNTPWCSHWSKRSNKRDSEREYGAWSAAACGKDYELLPTGPDAFFDRDIKGNVWNGSNKPPNVYNGCFKMCPAGTEAVPGGTFEASGAYCASQCPINTRVDPTKPQNCVKDGFERAILITNMQRIRDLS